MENLDIGYRTGYWTGYQASPRLHRRGPVSANLAYYLPNESVLRQQRRLGTSDFVFVPTRT